MVDGESSPAFSTRVRVGWFAESVMGVTCRAGAEPACMIGRDLTVVHTFSDIPDFARGDFPLGSMPDPGTDHCMGGFMEQGLVDVIVFPFLSQIS